MFDHLLRPPARKRSRSILKGKDN